MVAIPKYRTMVLVDPSFVEKIDVGERVLEGFLSNMVSRPCIAMIINCVLDSVVSDPNAAGSLLSQLAPLSCDHGGGMSVAEYITSIVGREMPNLAVATANPRLSDLLRAQVQILEPPVAKDKKRKRRGQKRKGGKVERRDETDAGKLEAHPAAEGEEKRKKRRRRGAGTREC